MSCSESTMMSDDRRKLHEGDYRDSDSDVALFDIDEKIESLERNVRAVNSAIFVETSDDGRADTKRQYLTAKDFYEALSKRDDRSETDIEQKPEIRYVNSAIFVENMSTSDEDAKRVDGGNPVLVTRSCVIDKIDFNTRDFYNGFQKEDDARHIPTLKLSESSSATTTTMTSSVSTLIDDVRKSRSDSYDEWYAMKELEKMKREREVMRMREIEREEKQKRLVQQREDFKCWLEMKKREEEKLKLERELLAEKQKLIEQIREKKSEQSMIAYKNWLKIKTAQEKEKKRFEEEKIQLEREETERRKRMNEIAFRQWLRKAKATPKPVPLNKGIETLRGAASVMYINPSPWKENINVMEC